MADPIGAAIAFSALGANVLATALLLLFNPRSRALRWYAVFLTAISTWLLARGVLSITGDWTSAWATVFAAAVFAIPGLFVSSTLVQMEARSWTVRGALAVTAAATGLGVVVMTTPATLPLRLLGLAWQIGAWGAGSLLQWRASRDERPLYRDQRRTHGAMSILLILPGIVVAGAMLLGGDAFFTYVMPLLIFVIHIIVFVGVVRLRFYDIEVRAARSGETASRAVEAERLAAVGELAASVAHEVRNPLTGVRSLAQRMAEEDLDSDRWRRYAGVIVEEVGRVDRIVANLLDVARRAPDDPDRDPGPTPLGPLFDDLLLLSGGRARRAGVTLEAHADGLAAPAPREPLAQVLLNLLLNAIQHSPDGGTVRLLARERDHGLTLVVRDAGPGVPPGQRDRIFEPFHTAGTDGTGLGLSIVRRIARERGWSVTVDDAPGGGAEFRVLLPRVAEASA